MIIEELVALLGFDLKGEADLKRFETGLEKARRGISTFQATMAGFAGGLAAGIATELVSTLGRGLASLPQGAIEAGASFEKLHATLETIEGSSQKAKASLNWVQQFAATTPFDLEQVAEGFVRLRAYGLDPLDGSLASVGNAASAMGKTLMDGVEAVADAAQGEFERLKEFGVRASAEGKNVTLSWQQNGKTLTKTVTKDGAAISKALKGIFDQRFAGAMAKQSKTWNGMVSNMGDAWLGFKKQIADAGWFDYVRSKLSDLLDWINDLKTDGSLDRWARNISTSLIRAGQSVERFGRFFARLAKAVPWKQMAAGVALLAVRLFPITAAITAAAFALDDFLTYMEGGESVIGSFIGWLRDLLGISEGAAQSLTALAVASGVLAFRLGAVGRALGALGPMMRFLAKFARMAAWLSIGTAVISEWDRLKEIWQSGEGILTKINQTVATIIRAMVNDIGDIFGIEKLSDRLDALEQNIKDTFNTAVLEPFAAAVQAYIITPISKIIELANRAAAAVQSIIPQGGFSMGLGAGGTPAAQPDSAGSAAGSAIGNILNNQGGAGPDKRSSLEGPNGRSLASLVSPNVTQTINAPVTVQVAQTNASPSAIGSAVAGALGKTASRKNLFFTADSPATA